MNNIDKRIEVLDAGWGHARTRDEQKCIDCNGEAIPWFSYPSIEYLQQLDFSDSNILEWGSGWSSLFWSKRAKKVVSVERDEEWFNFVKNKNIKNLDVYLVNDDEEYIHFAENEGGYDVIVIDGELRKYCAQYCIQNLNSGGMVILDNSDKYPEAAVELRKLGLVGFDFFGFGPINEYTWCTTIYLKANFKFGSKNEQFPTFAVGGRDAIVYE